MTKYVAFLRGINVGGNKKVPMSDLKKLFESLGFTDVKTLLNSGNIVFEAEKADIELIEAKLKEAFGFGIPVILRTGEQIQKLADSSPFKKVSITPDTRLYITFLSEKPQSRLKVPYESMGKSFNILQVTDGEVISILTLSAKFGTTDAMKILEKEFGKNVTTRNWSTIAKFVWLTN